MKATFHAIEQALPKTIGPELVADVVESLWAYKQHGSEFTVLDVSETTLRDPHFLGWVLCAVMDEKRRAAYRTNLSTGNKSQNVSATTQTFTPRHLVDMLLDDLDVVSHDHVYDPCCGAGQFLLATFDRKLNQKVAIEDIVTQISGSDIDSVAVQIARTSLKLRLFDVLGDRNLSLEKTIDAQIGTADVFDTSTSADIVVTNPPFMGRRYMNDSLRAQTDLLRPFHHDIYLAVIHRCQQLATRGVGIVAPQTLWFLKKFGPAREALRTWGQITTFHHLGSGQFPNLRGEKSSVVMFTQKRESVGDTKFFDRRPTTDVQLSTPNKGIDSRPMSDFDRIPGAPIAHWLTDAQIQMFERFKPLGDFIEIPSPNKTADNATFVRPIGTDIFLESRPYHKGGAYAPWWSTAEWEVDWSENAQAHYSNHATANLYRGPQRDGIGYIDFASGVFNAKLVAAETIPDMTGPMIFLNTSHDTEPNRLRLLAYLNSSIARTLLVAMNPTVHFQMTDVKRLPIPAAVFENDQLSTLAQDCIDVCRTGVFENLEGLENQIDQICASLTGATSVTVRRRRRDRR